jgi:hypothetical protein
MRVQASSHSCKSTLMKRVITHGTDDLDQALTIMRRVTSVLEAEEA